MNLRGKPFSFATPLANNFSQPAMGGMYGGGDMSKPSLYGDPNSAIGRTPPPRFPGFAHPLQNNFGPDPMGGAISGSMGGGGAGSVNPMGGGGSLGGAGSVGPMGGGGDFWSAMNSIPGQGNGLTSMPAQGWNTSTSYNPGSMGGGMGAGAFQNPIGRPMGPMSNLRGMYGGY
jgi:hypothetical protein